MDLGAPFRFAGEQVSKIPGVKQLGAFFDSPLGKGINRTQSLYDAYQTIEALKEGRYVDAGIGAVSTLGTMPKATYNTAKAILAAPLVKPLIGAAALTVLDQRPAGASQALYGPGTPYATRAEFDAAERNEGTVKGRGGATATLSQTPPDPGAVQTTPATTTTSTATTPRQPTSPAGRQTDTPVRANDETAPEMPIELTKDDLYESARARAVQTGKQQDLDLVRDLGLAMHAQHFDKKSELNLSDQTARAKSFLETKIA